MALPEQVLERLSREPPQTPGWSAGLLLFSGGLLFVAVAVYIGLLFGYEPYVSSQIDALNVQMNTLAKLVSPSDEAQLVALYSESANLEQVLANHVTLSSFFAWLEKNTEANVYYTSFGFSSGDQIALEGSAASEADVNQQMAIFEVAPEVKSVALSSVSLNSQNGTWRFAATLVMNALSPPTQ